MHLPNLNNVRIKGRKVQKYLASYGLSLFQCGRLAFKFPLDLQKTFVTLFNPTERCARCTKALSIENKAEISSR